MQAYNNLLFENQNGVGLLTMNRPAAFNALNRETMDELADFFGAAAVDPALKVLVITGADKAFVAGADIKCMLPMSAAEGGSLPESSITVTGINNSPFSLSAINFC